MAKTRTWKSPYGVTVTYCADCKSTPTAEPELCPLHAAAPALLELAKEVLKIEQTTTYPVPGLATKARAAIAQAKGDAR